MTNRVNAAMAFTAIPKITPDQWKSSNLLIRWMIASRAAVLVMTFSSAALAGALAMLAGDFQLLPWLSCTLGLLLAHAANNQLNDYTDSARGIDGGNYFRNQYGAHVLEDGLLSKQQLRLYMCLTGGAALGIGIYLLWVTGPALLVPLAAGAFFLLFYTYPLKKLGLGEPAVLLVWGPLMTGATFMVTTGSWSWQVALIGTVYALAPTVVIFGKHVDKLDFDADKGVRTLPVRLGVSRSLQAIVAMVVLQYLVLGWLIVSDMLPWSALLTLLALPDALRLINVCRQPRPQRCPDDFPLSAWPLWYVAYAFVYARSFGLLFLCGLLLAWLVQAAGGLLQ